MRGLLGPAPWLSQGTTDHCSCAPAKQVQCQEKKLGDEKSYTADEIQNAGAARMIDAAMLSVEVKTERSGMNESTIDTDLIDEAVLALMYLTLHDTDHLSGLSRSWKSFDWGALDRLYKKDLILDPAKKAKSVVLTEEGRQRSEELFGRLFVRRS